MSNPNENKAKAAGGEKTSRDGEFNLLLDNFKRSIGTAMECALKLSHIAIVDFAEHGNLSYAQRFLDDMPLNFTRKAAFIEWLRDHSPLKVEGSLEKGYTLSKDKAPDASPFRVEVALKVAFWEYAPEKETINFDEKDIVKALKATINKFRKERYHAKSDRAVVALTECDMVMRHLENAISNDKALSITETANDATVAVTPAVKAA